MCLCLSLGRAVGLEPKNEDEDLQRLAAADEDLLAGVWVLFVNADVLGYNTNSHTIRTGGRSGK